MDKKKKKLNEAENAAAKEQVSEEAEEVKETAEEKAPETEEAKPETEAQPETEAPKEESESEKVLALTDRLQRLMAEFDNYRKRTEKEKAAQYDNGMMKAVEKLLPVVDNFERGMASVKEEDRANSIYEGMDKIYKQLMKTLEDMGVTPIEAVGKAFDANFHNAVMQVENPDFPSNTVVTELQKGFTYKGTVIRYSMVTVNQ